MPRLYERTARQDIFRYGKKTKANNKQGFVIDRGQPRDTNDFRLVRKGNKYFTWHPKGSDWQYSIHRPDLRSDWQRTIDEFREKIDTINGEEYLDGAGDSEEDVQQEIQDKIDELQTNLDNMPEQLQEGHILKDRIEELEQLLEELN